MEIEESTNKYLVAKIKFISCSNYYLVEANFINFHSTEQKFNHTQRRIIKIINNKR